MASEAVEMTDNECQQLVEFLGRKFEEIDRRFDGIDDRFEALETKLGDHDDRFREILALLTTSIAGSTAWSR